MTRTFLLSQLTPRSFALFPCPAVAHLHRRRPSAASSDTSFDPTTTVGRLPRRSLFRRQPTSIQKSMGGEEDAARSRKVAFVTVGTTCFDALVKAVDTGKVKEELARKGFTDLIIQMGRGSFIPTKVSRKDGCLAVDYFTFSPSIVDYLRSASLVISHAGSGSIFESLKLGKPLIVVVNEDLMDNHQSELAEELAHRKHLYCARPQTLHQTIEAMDLDSLIPYQPGDAMPVVRLINQFLGFPTN